MLNIRAQCVIPMWTGLPTDVITNTLHFRDITPNESLEVAALAINPTLQTFYDSIYSSMPSYVMSPASTHEVRYYDLGTPAPRAPYVLPLRATGYTAVDTVVPTEVACCLSFEGLPVSGQPQARRRGRIYLGALTDAKMFASSSDGFPTLAFTFTSQIAASATLMRNTLEAGQHPWIVWSPTDNDYTLVARGWVDNTPDTQRRRGVVATSRQIWS